MNTTLPILIVLALGAAQALILHRFHLSLWVVSAGGALNAAAIWCYVFSSFSKSRISTSNS